MIVMITVTIKCDKCGTFGGEAHQHDVFKIRRILKTRGWAWEKNNPFDLCPDCSSLEWKVGPIACDLCGADSGFVREKRKTVALDNRKPMFKAGWRELRGIAHCMKCHKTRVGRRIGEL